MLSVALAETVSVPETVAPAVGVMMEAAGGVMSVNVAVTVVAALRVTMQGPVPAQPPPGQPVKEEPAAGAAGWGAAGTPGKRAGPVAPQMGPTGGAGSVPLSAPGFPSVRAKSGDR